VRFEAVVREVPDVVRAEMHGRSWREAAGCPTFESLRLLELPHWDFAGRVARGELVVAAAVATDVVGVFARLFDARFPIEKMRRIDHYGGDDRASMADNNSSGFNFRTIEGSATLSRHASGLAIDINPFQNPYITPAGVLPPGSEPFLDRGRARPGMIIPPSVVVDGFAAIGWRWGGEWRGQEDFHHFFLPGD
jgi:hypothetical protein